MTVPMVSATPVKRESSSLRNAFFAQEILWVSAEQIGQQCKSTYSQGKVAKAKPVFLRSTINEQQAAVDHGPHTIILNKDDQGLMPSTDRLKILNQLKCIGLLGRTSKQPTNPTHSNQKPILIIL